MSKPRLLSIKMKKDYRCLLKDQQFDLYQGINVLVGDQGCGKSSLLDLIGAGGKKSEFYSHQVAFPIKTYAFDFEKDNPRMKEAPYNISNDGFKAMMANRWSSHGESNKAVIKALKQLDSEDYYLIIMDEPETGLSVRSIIELKKYLVKLVAKDRSILMATHNERLMECADHLFSMEHRKAMTAKEFVESHGG